MAAVPVTRPVGADPRIDIWGTLEARLQSVDLIILGGLDEGVWPAETRTDPWLSRAMRAEIGLPPPERRIGLAAHDFAEAFAAPRVLVTRAEKRGGTPTVASRWLQRFAALVGEAAIDRVQARGDIYVELARDIDRWPRRPDPVEQAGAEAGGRRAAAPPVGHRDRGPRSRSLCHLRQTCSAARAARSARPGARLRAPRLADPRRPRHLHARLDRPFRRRGRARAPGDRRRPLPQLANSPMCMPSGRCASRRSPAGSSLGGGARRRRSPPAMPRSAAGSSFAAPAGLFTLRGRADRIDLRRDGAVECSTSRPARRPRRSRC